MWIILRVHLPPHLLDDRAVALARCAHRVAVRAQVHGGQQGVVGSPQQHRLGGGGAHVEAQDADVSRPEGAAFDGFELHHAGEISERREACEDVGPVGKKRVDPGEGGGLVGQGPQGGPQRLQVGRLRGHDQPRDLLAQVFDHHAVLGRAADHHDVAALHLLEQFENLVGHHLAQAGSDLGLGDALVRGVGAVGLAEHRAAPRHVVRGFHRRPLGGLFQADVHAPQLLQEKFAGAGGALVAGDDVADAPGPVQHVDHEGLAAGGHHGRAVDPGGFDEGVGGFDRLGLRDGGQVDKPAELASGGGDPVERAHVQSGQRPHQGALGVPLVRVKGMVDDARRRHPGGVQILFHLDQGNGGSAHTDPQRFQCLGHGCLRHHEMPAGLARVSRAASCGSTRQVMSGEIA